MSGVPTFTVWTVQKRAVVNYCLTNDFYCPNFGNSDYLSETPALSSLYDMLLEAYNNVNSETLEGVVLKLRLRDTNNPLFIDFNNFQLLMPPILILPPYTQEYCKSLICHWIAGKYVKGILNPGLVQAHLPALVKEDLLGIYPMFTI